jgi:hypothetical protein
MGTVVIALTICRLKAKKRDGIAAANNNIDAAVGLFIAEVMDAVLLPVAAVRRSVERKNISYHTAIPLYSVCKKVGSRSKAAPTSEEEKKKRHNSFHPSVHSTQKSKSNPRR